MTAELPLDLQELIRAGGAVRTNPQEDHAGRCGAAVDRRNAGSVYCQRGAGWGTDHKGVGRCKSHPLHAPGLPPWAGDTDPEMWRRATGHNVPGPDGALQTTHGATAVLTLEQRFSGFFEGDDRELYDSIPDNEPVRVLDLIIRTRLVALGRVEGYVAQARRIAAGAGQQASFDKIAGPTAMADRIAGTIARLQEVRAKYVELDKRDESLEGLAAFLQQLPDADLAAVYATPGLLATFRPGHFTAPPI